MIDYEEFLKSLGDLKKQKKDKLIEILEKFVDSQKECPEDNSEDLLKQISDLTKKLEESEKTSIELKNSLESSKVAYESKVSEVMEKLNQEIKGHEVTRSNRGQVLQKLSISERNVDILSKRLKTFTISGIIIYIITLILFVIL